ncbi:DDE 3 domain-containing protein [Aphis craccivora]|uniref:DDE 3 domain-containing protein n=1 Tax=Aphis craccivora TaxID=307492 RepID=A0A6G0W9H6_APHCR|nr:DDE 3 domain-containing protein [Aphis craccivora]
MVIPQILYIVKRLKPIHNKYVINELVKAKNHTVLYELNPIELAWSSVKNHVRMNNTTYKLPAVKNLLIEGIKRVDAEMFPVLVNFQYYPNMKYSKTKKNK